MILLLSAEVENLEINLEEISSTFPRGVFIADITGILDVEAEQNVLQSFVRAKRIERVIVDFPENLLEKEKVSYLEEYLEELTKFGLKVFQRVSFQNVKKYIEYDQNAFLKEVPRFSGFFIEVRGQPVEFLKKLDALKKEMERAALTVNARRETLAVLWYKQKDINVKFKGLKARLSEHLMDLADEIWVSLVDTPSDSFSDVLYEWIEIINFKGASVALWPIISVEQFWKEGESYMEEILNMTYEDVQKRISGFLITNYERYRFIEP